MGRWAVLAAAMAFAIVGCTDADQEPDAEQEPAQSAETTDTDQDSEAGAEPLSEIEETAASICEAVADRPEETVYERRITLGVRNGHNEQELRSAVADECGDIIAAIEDPEPDGDVSVAIASVNTEAGFLVLAAQLETDCDVSDLDATLVDIAEDRGMLDTDGIAALQPVLLEVDALNDACEDRDADEARQAADRLLAALEDALQ